MQPEDELMRTAFNPFEHGFKFSNVFTNPVIRIPSLGIDFSTRGRCGGMAWAALDYYVNNLAVPAEDSLPRDGSPLADYCYSRLMENILANGWKFVHFMRTPLHPTLVNGIGVARATREEELPRLRQLLDSGKPCTLGLCQSTSLGELGNDHQVVAYGYEEQAPFTRIFIYDVNHPNDVNHPSREVTLDLTATYASGEWEIRQSTGEVWRGLFVVPHPPMIPPYLQDGRLLSELQDPAVYVVRGGGRFHVPSPAEFTANAYSWANIAEMQADSLRHVATWPANGTLIHERSSPAVHVTYGGVPIHIPNPGVFSALGFDWSKVNAIPDGSLAGLRKFFLDRTLLREQNDPKVYVAENGRLRHVPSIEAFDAHGFVWESVNVVPDGALASVPKGPPLPNSASSHTAIPGSWAERGSGELITADGDRLSFSIEPSQVPADQVEFVLELGPDITWRKEIILVASDGEWTIAALNSTRSASNGLYRYQLPNGRLRFRKAKIFGIMTDVYSLHSLDRLPEGARVRFRWLKD
jgi:hypothetical protein